jgi:hypothetical protein
MPRNQRCVLPGEACHNPTENRGRKVALSETGSRKRSTGVGESCPTSSARRPLLASGWLPITRNNAPQPHETWLRRRSHPAFRSNEVRLWLSVIAYNLGNLWRRLVLPKRIDHWSLTSLQQRLVKTGGRLVKHARYYWLLLAEGHLTRRVFAAILRRIWALPLPTG